MRVFLRILVSGLSVGLGFAVLGFFGPMLLAPGDYTLPLTGVYVAGPIGFAVGAAIGCLSEFRRD